MKQDKIERSELMRDFFEKCDKAFNDRQLVFEERNRFGIREKFAIAVIVFCFLFILAV